MSVWLIIAGALCCLYTAVELGRLLERRTSPTLSLPRAFDTRTGRPIAIRVAPSPPRKSRL